jgi:hypothetical protein
VVDSARAGYFKNLDGAGTPPVDPVVRSEVRERLLQKRREPFTQEMGKEILERLKDDRWVRSGGRRFYAMEHRRVHT